MPGKRSGSEFADRHVRGSDIFHRQLALGGRCRFTIRSGKKLPHGRLPTSLFRFNNAPHAMFTAHDGDSPLQPNLTNRKGFSQRRISLRFPVEAAGRRDATAAGVDGFQIRSQHRRAIAHAAYETCCWVDAMKGDATLYARRGTCGWSASWRVGAADSGCFWSRRKFDFPEYEPRGRGGQRESR